MLLVKEGRTLDEKKHILIRHFANVWLSNGIDTIYLIWRRALAFYMPITALFHFALIGNWIQLRKKAICLFIVHWRFGFPFNEYSPRWIVFHWIQCKTFRLHANCTAAFAEADNRRFVQLNQSTKLPFRFIFHWRFITAFTSAAACIIGINL